jgi:hypothetical protein
MKKRYADGGGVDEELIVEGMRPQNFNLASLARGSASGGMGPMMPGGGGGMPALTSTSRRGASQPANSMRFGKVGTAAGPVYGVEYQGENFNVGAGLGRGLLGRKGAPMFGANASFEFAKGGKVKKKPVKKMAKGGSTASKRADGCATKGKTKGRFV